MGHIDRAALIAWVKGQADVWRARAFTPGLAIAAHFDAIAALLEADKAALLGLYTALGKVWGDPEDCDACCALSEAGEADGCALHGDAAAPLYQAMQVAIELIGPCVCGHPKSCHEDVDSTHCHECHCQQFVFPTPPVTEAKP